MYNLLIVDDEPFITDGLKIVFEDYFLDETDIYVANSGVEALKWLKKIRIDIIISDINMPNMTGLELQKIVNKKWPFSKIIFLSAYDDISYVRPALKGNAVDYLVKTCTDEEIIDTVKKAMKIIEDEEENKRMALREMDRSVIPLLKQDLCINLIEGNIYEKDELLSRFNELGINFDASNLVKIMLVRIDSISNMKALSNNWEGLLKIGSIFDKYLSPYMNCIWFVYKQKEVVFLIQTKERDSFIEDEINSHNDLYIFITGVLKIIQKSCVEIVGRSVSVAVLKNSSSFEHISMNYEKLLLNFNYAFGFEKELIMDEFYMNDKDDKLYSQEKIAFELKYTLNEIQELSSFLEDNQLEDFKDRIDKITRLADGTIDIRSKISVEIFVKISSTLITYINRIEGWEYISKYIDLEKLNNMHLFENWLSVKKYFIKTGEYIIASKLKKEMENRQFIVDKVNLFIKENIHEDISLVQIAEFVNFNPYYLSRLYKQLSGKNISDYIKEIRLIKSKQLLSQSDMSINEIAEAVGFTDGAYFSRFFKKNTNVTPAKYRKSLL